ncbi:hypothetical protein SLS58_005559 [Diplodia intermedia]|uniref:SWIRM domain-containing protein n=1 Tax=Diplodia intermedia TaxID=856260 RepID=A0ABR3TQP0_9PEZI
MASQHTTATPSKPDARFSVSSLLSPPEMKRSESFSKSPADCAMDATPAPALDCTINRLTVNSLGSNIRSSAKGLPPSPPVSPFDNLHKEDSQCSVEEDTSRDPPLFPAWSGDKIGATTAPLFPSVGTTPEQEALISRHIAESRLSNVYDRPTREEYQLAIACKSIAVSQWRKNPVQWMRNERATWSMYGPKKSTQRSHLRALAPAPAGVRKTKPAAPRLPRAPRVTKRTPKAALLESFDAKPPTPKAPKVQASRDDVDFHKIPNYAPPLETLPEDGRKALKAEWKGQPLDLSADPDRGELHPSELNVASTLRLTCATYLYNKRRIFQARVRALLRGEDFNKTKAQQACKIDVNKASKLWAAYEKIGWFKPIYFQQHLDNFNDWEN